MHTNRTVDFITKRMKLYNSSLRETNRTLPNKATQTTYLWFGVFDVLTYCQTSTQLSRERLVSLRPSPPPHVGSHLGLAFQNAVDADRSILSGLRPVAPDGVPSPVSRIEDGRSALRPTARLTTT